MTVENALYAGNRLKAVAGAQAQGLGKNAGVKPGSSAKEQQGAGERAAYPAGAFVKQEPCQPLPPEGHKVIQGEKPQDGGVIIFHRGVVSQRRAAAAIHGKMHEREEKEQHGLPGLIGSGS